MDIQVGNFVLLKGEVVAFEVTSVDGDAFEVYAFRNFSWYYNFQVESVFA